MNREEWDRIMNERSKGQNKGTNDGNNKSKTMSNDSKKEKGDGMPAKSKKQQAMMAIAAHNPNKLFKKNKGVLGMSKNQLSDFASTPTKGLPTKVKAKVPVKGLPTKIKGKAKSKVKGIKKESIGDFIRNRNKETAKKW